MKKKMMITVTFAAGLLSACGQSTTQETSTTTTTAATTTTATTTIQSETTTATTAVPQAAVDSVKILEQEETLGTLLQIFAQQYGSLDITGIELQSSVQPYVYKVSAIDDTTEYEFTYQSSTKSFVEVKTERADGAAGSERSRERIDISQLRNVDEIIATALIQAANAQMQEWSVDNENGRVVWSVEIFENRRTIEVEIDNATGQVLNVEY